MRPAIFIQAYAQSPIRALHKINLTHTGIFRRTLAVPNMSGEITYPKDCQTRSRVFQWVKVKDRATTESVP